MLFYCPHGLFTRPTLGLASIGFSGLYCRWTSCAIQLLAAVVILSHGCSDQNLTPCAFACVIIHFHISEITIPCVRMALYETSCVRSGLHQCVPLRALSCCVLFSSMLCRPIIRVACHRLARPHCSHFVCMLIRSVFLSPIRYAVSCSAQLCFYFCSLWWLSDILVSSCHSTS